MLACCLAPPLEHPHELGVIPAAFGSSLGGLVPARNESFDAIVIPDVQA